MSQRLDNLPRDAIVFLDFVLCLFSFKFPVECMSMVHQARDMSAGLQPPPLHPIPTHR